MPSPDALACLLACCLVAPLLPAPLLTPWSCPSPCCQVLKWVTLPTDGFLMCPLASDLCSFKTEPLSTSAVNKRLQHHLLRLGLFQGESTHGLRRGTVIHDRETGSTRWRLASACSMPSLGAAKPSSTSIPAGRLACLPASGAACDSQEEEGPSLTPPRPSCCPVLPHS